MNRAKNVGGDASDVNEIHRLQELAMGCWRSENYPQAEQTYRQAISLAESVVGSKHALIGELVCQLGHLRVVQEQFGEAIELGEKAVKVLESCYGTADLILVSPLQLLANAHFDYRDDDREHHLNQSEKSFLRAIAILERCGERQQLASLLSELGWFYYFTGRYEEAEKLYVRVQAIIEESSEPDLQQIANCAWKLALIYNMRDEFGKDASPFYARAHAALEKLHGPEHPEVAENLLRHGMYLHDRKRDEDAAPLYEQSITMLNAHPEWNSSTIRWMRQTYAEFRKNVGHETTDVTVLGNNESILANIEAWANAGKCEMALSCREEIERKEKLLGPNHPDVAEALYRCALHLQFENHTSKEPEKLLLRALSIQEKARGLDDPSLVESLLLLARFWQSEHRFEEARQALARGLRIRQGTDGPGSVGYANVLERQAHLERACGSYAQAECLYQRAMAIYEKEFEPDSYTLAEALWQFGRFYEERGEFDKALQVTQRLVPLAEKYVRGDCSAFDYLALHARVLYALGKMQEWQATADYYKALSTELGYGERFDAYLIPRKFARSKDDSGESLDADITVQKSV